MSDYKTNATAKIKIDSMSNNDGDQKPTGKKNKNKARHCPVSLGTAFQGRRGRLSLDPCLSPSRY
jgi:hypothetical protein